MEPFFRILYYGFASFTGTVQTPGLGTVRTYAPSRTGFTSLSAPTCTRCADGCGSYGLLDHGRFLYLLYHLLQMLISRRISSEKVLTCASASTSLLWPTPEQLTA